MGGLLPHSRKDSPKRLIMAHRLLGTNFMFGGQLQSALTHFERALTLYGPAYRPSPLFLQTSEVRTSCLGFSALTLLCLGYPDRGLTRSHEALVAADELRHAHTLSNILHLNCWFHQLLGNREIVREQAARQNSLAREHGFPVWVGSGMVFHGWA